MSVRKDSKRGTWIAEYYVKDPVTLELRRTSKRGFASKKEATAYCYSVSKVATIHRPIRSIFVEFLGTLQCNETSKAQHLTRFDHYVPFKNTPIDKITRAMLVKWASDLKEVPNPNKLGGKLSNTTINRLMAFVKSTYKYANIVYEVPDISTCLPRYKIERAERDILTPAEFELAMSFEDDPLYKAFFYTAYWTGCRRGELRALLKSDVFDGCLNIHQTMRRDISTLRQGTKTSKNTKVVRLDSATLAMLEPYLEGDGFLFGGDDPLTNTSLDRHLKHCVTEAGINKRISMHCLRHSHGSVLLANGLDLATVSKRLGHASISTTADIYSHVLDKTGQKSVDLIEQIRKKP